MPPGGIVWIGWLISMMKSLRKFTSSNTSIAALLTCPHRSAGRSRRVRVRRSVACSARHGPGRMPPQARSLEGLHTYFHPE